MAIYHLLTMHEYYTPKDWYLQVKPAKNPIFVDYADFLCKRSYVNLRNYNDAIMSNMHSGCYI